MLGELQTKRNGIVHRGGELNDGTMIQLTPESLGRTFDATGRIRLRMRALSEWCQQWWMQDITRRFAI
ncbi:MAG: hypothetical protein DMD91_25040 [Candidatus Rokuibacteriota bacterium]|nr:MAG: hypothetical protein DMD91_25040 [Candidatus Rokubacteria bacterium]